MAARSFSNSLILKGLHTATFLTHVRNHEIPIPPACTCGAMKTIVKQKARNLSRWSLLLAIMNHFSHHRYTKQPNSVTMVLSHHKTRHLGRFMIENRPRCRSVIVCICRYGRVTSSIGSYFSGTEPDGVNLSHNKLNNNKLTPKDYLSNNISEGFRNFYFK